METYFEKREINSIDKLNSLILELPYYVQDFFVGIETNTTPLTRLNYGYDLRIFFNFLSTKILKNKKTDEISFQDLSNLSSMDFEYFLSYLSHYQINGKNERCTETGKARKLSTLRAFYKYFFNKNILPANTPEKVQMPKIHEKEIIRLDRNDKIDEISDMLNTVSSGEGLTKRQLDFYKQTRIRDIAIVTLFLGTGIRISELVGLNLEDIDLNSNKFVVTRKGGNRAILYFNNEVKKALNDYIVIRTSNNQVSSDEYAMFLSLKNQRISVRQVQDLVKKYALIASPLKKITPHKLRSTFGTNLYRQTGDIYAVANCLGHKDVNTTRKHYAAISEDLKKNIILNYDISNNEKKTKKEDD